MSEQLFPNSTVGEFETIEHLGFEWCKPRGYYESCRDGVTRIPYAGTINMKTSEGYLLLCRVEKYNRGCMVGVRRTPVRPEDLNFAD